MGNCLRSDRAVPRNEEQERATGVDEMKRKRKLTESNLEEKRMVVRVKVVVTREELEQIMNCNKGDYLEELMTAMKLRGRRVSEVRKTDNNEGSNRNWRPALESIPEDH